jgi:hypothetical protein
MDKDYLVLKRATDSRPPASGTTTIERKPISVYLAYASCWSGWGKDVEPPWTEQLELRVGDGTLTITYLPERLKRTGGVRWNEGSAWGQKLT